jgi:hypothetical protein
MRFFPSYFLQSALAQRATGCCPVQAGLVHVEGVPGCTFTGFSPSLSGNASSSFELGLSELDAFWSRGLSLDLRADAMAS